VLIPKQQAALPHASVELWQRSVPLPLLWGPRARRLAHHLI